MEVKLAESSNRKTMSKLKRVLILCTGNSARSQMAEGLLRHEAGNWFEVHSAGVNPSSVRPEAIKAMSEIGIDISGSRSKSVDEFAGENFDYIITVCNNAKETCPVFPGEARRIHKNFEDPPPGFGWQLRLADGYLPASSRRDPRLVERLHRSGRNVAQ